MKNVLKIFIALALILASASAFAADGDKGEKAGKKGGKGGGGGWDLEGAMQRMGEGSYSVAQLMIDATQTATKQEIGRDSNCDTEWLTATLASVKSLGSSLDNAYTEAAKHPSLDRDARQCLEDAFRKISK